MGEKKVYESKPEDWQCFFHKGKMKNVVAQKEGEGEYHNNNNNNNIATQRKSVGRKKDDKLENKDLKYGKLEYFRI